MGAENLNPLDELKRLDQQVDAVNDLDGLKPIFVRIDEIAKANSDDFEIQLVAGDIKQHLVNRGSKLKAQQAAPAAPAGPPPTVRLTPGTPAAVPPLKPEPPPTVMFTPPAPPPAAKAPGPPPLPPSAPAPPVKPQEEIQPPAKPMPSGQFPSAKPPESEPAGMTRPVVPPPVAPPPPPMATSAGPAATGQQPPIAPPNPPARAMNWKRPLMLGALLGAVVSIALIVFVVNQARKRNMQKEPAGALQVDVATTPPYAQIRINGETKCMSPCKVPLAPGNYQLMAFLDGYEAATAPVSITAGAPVEPVNLALVPQAQTVRILTDLDQGKVTFDDQPAADLQEGQFILDKVAPGTHTIKLAGRNNTEASFTFEIADGKAPALNGAVAAKNLNAVMVSTFGSQARIVTNSGPMKLAVNGQAEADAGPAGVDVKTFQPGVDEIVVGEGKDARNMKESFGPQPMLTAFLKSDLNIGTLIVSTGEDGVRVFVNDKENRRRTQRGQLRIQTIGPVTVRVVKDGFQTEPAQTAEVKKGAEVRLEFKLKPTPQVSTLQIAGGTPGAEVLIDQKNAGTIGQDGNFTANGIAPGDHTIDIRRDQYTPKRLTRSFKAGQPVSLVGGDASLALAAVSGTVRLARNPADAKVTYHRSDETQLHDTTAAQIELSPGTYIFSAAAPGYTPKTARLQIAAGETRTVDLALARAAAPAPAARAGDISAFADGSNWKRDGDVWTHRGGGFVAYELGPRGVYTFTVELMHGGNVFRGGRIRWCVQHVDDKNYQLFELDHKTFWAEIVENGKKMERNKVQHDLDKQKSYTIQIEVTPEHVVHKIQNPDGKWITLDSFSEPGRNPTSGKFGFMIQGNDEIGVSNFSFQPK